MNPPLRSRLGWPGSTSTPNADERGPMARVAFYLIALGATIGLVTLLVPGNARRDETASVAISLAAYALALVPLLGYSRLPLWAFDALAASATAAVTVGIYYGGDSGHVFALFYFSTSGWPSTPATSSTRSGPCCKSQFWASPTGR